MAAYRSSSEASGTPKSAASVLVCHRLTGYPESLKAQVQQLLLQGRLGETLLAKYSHVHAARTDRALYDYVMALKNEFLRNAEPLSKVSFDSKLQVITHALGTHTTVSRYEFDLRVYLTHMDAAGKLAWPAL